MTRVECTRRGPSSCVPSLDHTDRYSSVTDDKISNGCRSWDQMRRTDDGRAREEPRLPTFLHIFANLHTNTHTHKSTMAIACFRWRGILRTRVRVHARARVVRTAYTQMYRRERERERVRCTRTEGEARSFREPGRQDRRRKSPILNGARTDIARELEIEARKEKGTEREERGRYCEESRTRWHSRDLSRSDVGG